MDEISGVAQNTDRILWQRETQEEPFLGYASVGLTKEDALIVCVGGSCIVKPLEDWHEQAQALDRWRRLAQALEAEAKFVLGQGFSQEFQRLTQETDAARAAILETGEKLRPTVVPR